MIEISLMMDPSMPKPVSHGNIQKSGICSFQMDIVVMDCEAWIEWKRAKQWRQQMGMAKCRRGMRESRHSLGETDEACGKKARLQENLTKLARVQGKLCAFPSRLLSTSPPYFTLLELSLGWPSSKLQSKTFVTLRGPCRRAFFRKTYLEGLKK